MDPLLQSAIALQRDKRWAEAEQLYRQIVQSQPGHPTAWFEFGNFLAATGRIADAANAYRSAISASPDFAEAYCNLGNANQILGDLAGAKAAFERAVQLRPSFVEAWNNLGNVAQDQGDPASAITFHQRAIELRPTFVQAWYSLGGAFRSLKRLDEALEAYDRALRIHPAFDKAEVNRAGVLRDMGRQQEAIEALARAMQLNPRPETLSNLIYQLSLHPAYNAASIWPRVQQWDAQFAQPIASEIRLHTNDRTPDRRLRVGYVSPDFSVHPIGRFTLPLLENHDRASFEIYCYSNNPAVDDVTIRTRKAADHWRDVVRLSENQLAERIREDRIDILVDLTGHTAANRLLTFARKPAPVQVSWLGYPGSTGLKTIDYRLSDRYLDPPGDQQFYSEKTIELPDCYWCFDPLVDEPIPVGELPASSNGIITFGSLNNFAKVSVYAAGVWAQALTHTPGSRLMLLGPRGASRIRFQQLMDNSGIESGRITWLDRMPRMDYLKTYRQIDIVLDTFPYTGHTTTFDALWMGVPVMTVVGRTAVSRGSFSVLSNLGLGECIGDGPSDFMEKLAKLTSDQSRLVELRRTLRQRLEHSALMDKARFARGVEAAYRQMWNAWCEQPSRYS